MDRGDFIMRAEAGEIEDERELIEGVQAMIDDGTVWELQGSWGWLAAQLIEMGVCHPPKRVPAEQIAA